MFKLTEVRGIIGGIVFSLGLIAALIAASRVPAKLDAAATAMVQHSAQQDETNRQLRVLVCITGRIHSPLKCIAETK